MTRKWCSSCGKNSHEPSAQCKGPPSEMAKPRSRPRTCVCRGVQCPTCEAPRRETRLTDHEALQERARRMLGDGLACGDISVFLGISWTKTIELLS